MQPDGAGTQKGGARAAGNASQREQLGGWQRAGDRKGREVPWAGGAQRKAFPKAQHLESRRRLGVRNTERGVR